MYLVSKWFLMENGFGKARVIHGLSLKCSFCLEIFLEGHTNLRLN